MGQIPAPGQALSEEADVRILSPSPHPAIVPNTTALRQRDDVMGTDVFALKKGTMGGGKGVPRAALLSRCWLFTGSLDWKV